MALTECPQSVKLNLCLKNPETEALHIQHHVCELHLVLKEQAAIFDEVLASNSNLNSNATAPSARVS